MKNLAFERHKIHAFYAAQPPHSGRGGEKILESAVLKINF
jgi:hypothetical protein